MPKTSTARSRALVRASQSTLGHEGTPSHGGVYVLRGERLSADDRTLLQTAARAVLLSRRGSLADQVVRLERPVSDAATAPPPPARDATAAAHDEHRAAAASSSSSTDSAASTRTVASTSSSLGPGQSTPAPWLNVIANPSFGFQVSESGLRLHLGREQPGEPADAVVQRSGQRPAGRGAVRPRRRQRRRVEPDGATDPLRRLDLRGAARRRLQPVRARPRRHPARPRPVRAARRAGEGLRAQRGEPSGRRAALVASPPTPSGCSARRAAPARRGSSPSASRRPARCWRRNPWNAEFGGRTAFLDMCGRQTACTADRTEFLGRNGGPERPAGLARGQQLQRAVGAGLDPCAALQTSFELAAGASAPRSS